MPDPSLDVIQRRRRQIEEEIEDLTARIAQLRAELPDLAVAERVLSRLVGAAGGGAREVAESAPSPVAQGAARQHVKLPDLVVMALRRMQQRGLRGAEPKDVQTEITGVYGVELRPIAVSTTMWRMAQPKDGRLVKDGNLYRVAERNEAADLLSVGDTSAASNHQPVQGREAGPGGGT